MRASASALVLIAACGGGGSTGPANPKLEAGTHRVPVDASGNRLEVVIDVRGTGKIVCIAHPGGPGLTSEYLHLSAFESRFTMVYIDPLGTSGSSKLPAGQEYSRERDVAAVEAVRKKLGIAKPCLIGHSYGGTVILSYAAQHPDHVGSLFLYSTSPTNSSDWESDGKANLAWFKDQSFFADAMTALEGKPKPTDDASLTAAYVRILPLQFADWSGHKSEYAHLVAKLEVQYDVFARRPAGTKANAFDLRGPLGRLHTTPAVIVAGERDAFFGPKPASWIARSIADSKLIVIPHAGHFAHVEQPTAFDAAVEQFAAVVR